ncbi:MAG: hypothetical protein ACK53Y_02585, partial [bacterium]
MSIMISKNEVHSCRVALWSILAHMAAHSVSSHPRGHQVLVSELASPTLIPPPSSALAALFHALHHACGLDVGGKAGAG